MDSPKPAHQGVVDAIVKGTGLDPSTLPPETRLRDLGIKSIEMITILYELEDDYGIELINRRVDRFETVGEGIALVAELVGRKPPTPTAG